MSPGAYMAKVDLKPAYRSVPIHPSQYCMTGLKWTFSGDSKPTYFYDTRLCFGSKKAPSIFTRITQAIRRMMERLGYKLVVYLDDFCLVENSKEKCMKSLNTLIALLRSLGFDIAWNKVEGPQQKIIFLGIEFDSISYKMCLPARKITDIQELLASFQKRNRASLRQLQQLAGKLSYACSIIHGGRVYLQRVLDIMRPLRHASHKVKLSSHIHQTFKRIYNGGLIASAFSIANLSLMDHDQ